MIKFSANTSLRTKNIKCSKKMVNKLASKMEKMMTDTNSNKYSSINKKIQKRHRTSPNGKKYKRLMIKINQNHQILGRISLKYNQEDPPM